MGEIQNTINKVGFLAGLTAFAFAVLFAIVQTLEIVSFLSYPLDQILIYGFSLGIVIPLMLEILALHYVVPLPKKFFSHAALIFIVLYVAFVSANYVIQLTTVIPMTLKGNAGTIGILSQTPHSLFWDFDAIGYISMGFATFFAALALEKTGFAKWVRYSLLGHSIVTPLIAFVYFYPDFSDGLLLIATPWAITAPLFMVMLAFFFRENIRHSVQ